MIKVLHFVSTPSIGSGVMSVIMNYFRHMDRSKIQFDFLCFLPCKSPEASYEREIEKLGGRVFFVSKPGFSWGSIKELLLFFRENAKKYLWFHNHEVYLSFLLKPLSTRYGIPNFIVHSHTTKFSDRKPAAFRNGLLCSPIRFMHCTKFACSAEAGAFLFGKHAVSIGEVYILHNAIEVGKYVYNPEKRRAIREKFGLEGCFVIGHVGRFAPQKNHDFLISVFQELVQRMPEARLLLIGDGPLRKRVERRCREEGLNEQVLMLGQRTDVAELFHAMDVFALPSVFEGVGIALVEAQANGLSGIASDCVPAEAGVTGEVCFLPLRVDLWVEALFNSRKKMGEMREADLVEAFREAHYEIITEARNLQEFYEDTNTHVNV